MPEEKYNGIHWEAQRWFERLPMYLPGCDGEECPLFGGQLIGCDCPFDDRAVIGN
jgi:hypothetical protein